MNPPPATAPTPAVSASAALAVNADVLLTVRAAAESENSVAFTAGSAYATLAFNVVGGPSGRSSIGMFYSYGSAAVTVMSIAFDASPLSITITAATPGVTTNAMSIGVETSVSLTNVVGALTPRM